jgi:hypothetical protein
VTGNAGKTRLPTRFGNDYIRDLVDDRYTCLPHNLVGLNLLSEVFLDPPGADGADLMVTVDRYGIIGGSLMPTPIFVGTQRFFRLLRERQMRWFSAEVVHVNPGGAT